MKLRLMTLALLMTLMSALVLTPLSAAPVSAAAGIPVTITNAPVTAAGQAVGYLNGVLNVTGFKNQGGQLLALGTLTGNITSQPGGAGNVITTLTNQAVAVPVNAAQASCQILTLDLGPLHLDLLGLVVDLSAVHLTITAVPGAGNLLGNLLCAVAHLLDSNAVLGSLAGLLNQLLGAL